jgi:hypothetical protein
MIAENSGNYTICLTSFVSGHTTICKGESGVHIHAKRNEVLGKFDDKPFKQEA